MESLRKQEKRTLVNIYGKKLWIMRRMPSHGAHWLTGIFLPPHERLCIGVVFSPYKENNVVCSRGTSKSFTFCSMAAPLKAMLFQNVNALIVSASGFRGGKLLFEDTERLFHGQLKSQQRFGAFMYASVDGVTQKKVISKSPDMWTLNLTSNSSLRTVPTNSPDTIRGIRATELFVDERNTFDGEVVQKVLRPIINVGKDMRNTADAGVDNKIFQISTIDYSFRDWYPEIQQSNKLAKLEFEATKAREAGDWKEYYRIMNENDFEVANASFSMTRIDYTDLLIPDRAVCSDDGKMYQINYPVTKDITLAGIKKEDPRDRTTYYYTYPVDKKTLEEPLRSGTVEDSIWLAEQRNVFIETAGNVYPHDLIRKVSERPLYKEGQIKGFEDEWFAPVLYTCGDPCVIGLDYARESDHFAIVVIRLGELAKGDFDPTMYTRDDLGRICLGKTPWNSVIWAEAHKKWTAEQAAERVFELYKRYNIVHKPEIGRGIALDKGGGGSAVRDILAKPKAPANEIDTWVPEVILYDPEDEDYMHFMGLNDPKYVPCLELLKPTNQDNLEWTMGSKALMQQGKLYIAYWMAPSRWASDLGLVNSMGMPDDSHPEFHRMIVGYNGIRKLKEQLVKVQTKVTETMVIRFVMPGDHEKEENKKDMYSAFIYASHMARQHVVGLTKKDGIPPTAQPVIVEIGSSRNQASRGDIRGWTSIMGES